jgi:hypothetical protein
MSTVGASNLSAGFVDMATSDLLEEYMYSTGKSTSTETIIRYFVRETIKSSPFTQIPVLLSDQNSAGFGSPWTVTVSRSGDYLQYVWLRVELPEITFATTNSIDGATGTTNGRLRWTKNVGHALINKVALKFNDLVAEQFTGDFLDFWAAFNIPASKQVGYNNMIGNVPSLTDGVAPGEILPGYAINVPLPFFFSRDSGLALPTAALPYNEIKIEPTLRGWKELLILSDITKTVTENQRGTAIDASKDLGGVPSLSNGQCWGNYSLVSNTERTTLAAEPLEMLIEQVQDTDVSWNGQATKEHNIRFSHAIKTLYFGVKNITHSAEHSHWVTHSPHTLGSGEVDHFPSAARDPIANATLLYENTKRLDNLPADYFSLVNPFHHCPRIPEVTGLHAYSYSLTTDETDPAGSTNYSKLTNVAIQVSPSEAAKAAGIGTGVLTQTYRLHVFGVNQNILKVCGGAMGFPLL